MRLSWLKMQPQQQRIHGANLRQRHRNREVLYGARKTVHLLSSRRLLAMEAAVRVNPGHRHNQDRHHNPLNLLQSMTHGDSPFHLSNLRGDSSLPGNKYPHHQRLPITPRPPGNKILARDLLLVARLPLALAPLLCNQMRHHSRTTTRPCCAHPVHRAPSERFASKKAKNLDGSTRFVKMS